MIDHQPYGIDDPYKRLPTERFPRDPEPGDALQIGFRTHAPAREAWVVLTGDRGETRHAAVPLTGGLWAAHLPSLEAGAFSYTLHARTGDGESSAGPFDLAVGRWRRAERLVDVQVEASAVLCALEDGEGGRATLRLSFPTAGVCRAVFRPHGTPEADTGLPCEVRHEEHHVVVTTEGTDEGTELRLDRRDLSVEVRRPGEPVVSRSSARCRSSAGIEWLELPDGAIARFRTYYLLTPDEELYGLGERFAQPGLRGRRWDVRVYEEYKEQNDRTYLPVPFFVSSSAWGVWLESDAPSQLDARGAEIVFSAATVPSVDAELRQHWIVADAPYGVTAAFTRLTGEIALPPKWAFGPWMSANTWNSQAKAAAAVERTLAEDVPATVLVLEAWSDESTFYIFNDADYDPVAGSERLALADFRFGGRWPDPKALVDRCHAEGVRVLLWQIPVHKKLDAPHAQHDADEAHMLERGYTIRHADGAPYRNRGWWFTDALVLDVTHPEARDWWFSKRCYLFDDLGIDGLKTDGGEHLWGRDLVAHDGRRGSALVNRYAQAYVDAYHDYVTRVTGGDGLTFSRAGYTGAHRSPAHWAGDENSTWNAFRASIQAGLSAGLAGVSIWGWDLGGFSGEIPSAELYIRSTQMACFCPVMQYHSELHDASENRDRTPWNIAERTGDPRALAIYRAYAKLRMRLLDYLHGEAQALAATGQPLMRLPGLVWPESHDALMLDPSVYLFGRDLLVCPVLEKGAQAREVTLPPGAWVDFWSGARFEGGRTVLAPAPLERLPVFIGANSPRLAGLREVADTFEVG